MAIHQAGDRRAYELCGECARRFEAGLTRRPMMPIDPPLISVMRRALP